MEEDHRERKKRKMDEAKEEEEEENMRRNEEEERVEEFFALIRSTREIRDRLRSCGFKDQKKEEQINKDVDIVAKEIGVWNPTFRPEDFLDDHEKKISGTDLPLDHDSVLGSTSQLTDHAGASKIEVEEEEENVKEDNKGGKDSNNLDLELSL